MPRALPVPKSDFIGLDGIAHLATGGEPPLLKRHQAAFEAFAADKARGSDGYDAHWDVADRVRRKLAGFVGLAPENIALTANASEAIVKVVQSIEWAPGDSVVVGADDYASGRYALADLKTRGVDVRTVPSRGWMLDEADLLAACDTSTKLMYVAQVNAKTGQHLEIDRLSRGLDGTPTALLMDSSHALGVVPVPGHLCDFTVSAHYKFVLGVHDGMLGWNTRRRERFTPTGAGWFSATPGPTPDSFVRKPTASRAEFGNVGHLGAYLLSESLDYLAEIGIDAAAAHARRLSGRLIEGMEALGLDVMTPRDPLRRAANAAFATDDPAAVRDRLRDQGVLVWGDNGRVRASCHVSTTDDDVDRLLAALA
jgi:cysteine desulfurase/selenocysteine lyase